MSQPNNPPMTSRTTAAHKAPIIRPSYLPGSRKWLGAALACLGLGAIVWISMTPLNPDWLGYKWMFETEGAWLGDQGRDPLFVYIIALANEIFGWGGYEDFRFTLGWFFLFFTAAIAVGKIFPLRDSPQLPFAMALALISFGFSRFTIIIREGLAVTMVMGGIACFMHADAAKSKLGRNSTILFGLCLFASGALTHIVVAVYLGIMLIAFWLNGSPRLLRRRMTFVWIAMLAFGSVLLTIYLGNGLLNRALMEMIGDRALDQPELSEEQMIFWCFYGMICYKLSTMVRELIASGRLNGAFALAIRIAAGPVAFGTIVSIFVLLLDRAPNVEIVSYVRFLHLNIGFTLLVVATQSPRILAISFISVFLVVDQIRAILLSFPEYIPALN